MKNLIFILNIVIAFSSTVHAQEVGESQNSLPRVTKENVARLLPHVYQELLNFTQVLPRDTTVFHWTSHNDIFPSEKNADLDLQWHEYVNKYTLRRWTNGGPTAGGLYFAVDPLSSDGMGDDLLVMTVKKGIRYLADIDGEAQFSAEGVSELARFGCPRQKIGDLTVWNPDCDQSVVRTLFEATEIKFLTYDYVVAHQLPKFCGHFENSSAFIVFDPSVFDLERTIFFDSRFEMKPAFKRIARLIAKCPDSVKVDRVRMKSLLGSVKKPIQGPEFESWVKQSLFECVDAQ